MTQFINRNKPEKVKKKKTIFTHIISEGNKKIENATSSPEDFDTVEYLYSEGEIDVFFITRGSSNAIYLGKKGDEFED